MTDPLPPFSDARLEDPVYREDLLAKLEALISVLEVARAKVNVNLRRGVDAVDLPRLQRIRGQVSNTLKICRKARMALRGGPAIGMEDVLGTDIDALCSMLADNLGS